MIGAILYDFGASVINRYHQWLNRYSIGCSAYPVICGKRHDKDAYTAIPLQMGRNYAVYHLSIELNWLIVSMQLV